MQVITLITGNKGKVEEAERYLGMPLEHIALDILEVQSLDSEEIVREKAKAAYAQVGKPVLVEDVSFVCTALGGLPGPLIKWFEKELGNEGICRLLDGKDRSCTASVLYGFYDGTSLIFAKGTMKGSVPEHPRGERSFGWGDIFVPDGMTRTYAELSDEEQTPIAMRRKALEELRSKLEK